MHTNRGLMLFALVMVAGCASNPPPPEQPIVVEAEHKPFEVQAYVPPPDEPPPPDAPPPPAPEPVPESSDHPRQVDGGRYRLSIAALRTDEAANKWVQRAESMGYRAVVETETIDGVIWHRVVLPNYRTKADVLRAVDIARTDFGTSAWRLPNEK